MVAVVKNLDENAALRGRWETSYQKHQNFLFCPNEEVIRFVSKYIRKRVGLIRFEDPAGSRRRPRILDLGCGIGRHVIYLAGLGVEAYGVDLSARAIRTALRWAKQERLLGLERRVVQGDVRRLPWPSGHFDHALSHGVLDSMPWETARTAVGEVARVLRPAGFFYCDLVSGDDSRHSREFAGEERVTTAHEKGTVQSYFNFGKITRLIEGQFVLREAYLVQRQEVLRGTRTSRYHLVLQKGAA